MSKPKLIYFDAPVSRGEECRLALHLGGVDFDDVRVNPTDWPAMKDSMPYGALPVLEIPGRPAFGQSNAILVLIGRKHGLHPQDDFEAARHEAMMAHVEDLRAAIGPTIRMGEAEKQAAREALVANFLPQWGHYAERNIGDGPFFGGANLHVVDLKIHLVARWLTSGKLDHIPASVFDACPKLLRVHAAVHDHAGVKAWYAKG